MKPKVTIYIPSHNYGRFLRQAVESVIHQTYSDWEMIIVNDGSTDDTSEIANDYREKQPDRINVIENTKAKRLQACANDVLRIAKGDYIMRLDADDYLDENALLVLVHYLDQHKDAALVYPNYIYVNEEGEILEVEKRKKIGHDVELLDLPAHGACTMIRKRVLKSIGGYAEEYSVQDGYDLWLKVLHRYPVGNVATPLFYYRQHGESATRNEERILETRARIKRERAKLNEGPVSPVAVAVIGAKNTYKHLPNIVLTEVNGSPLIDYTVNEALTSGLFHKIVISTDSEEVLHYCEKYEEVKVLLRDPNLSNERVTTNAVVRDVVNHLEEDDELYPDVVVQLNVHSPLKRAKHIQKAIDTMMLYNSDAVISVYEDLDLHYLHEKFGLKPLSEVRHEQLRIERDALYVNNNAIRVTWRDALAEDHLSNLKIGHITMTREESLQIRTEFDLWLAQKILAERSN